MAETASADSADARRIASVAPPSMRSEFLMADLARITADPAVMMGKPIVRGTRLTVEHILDELAGGLTVDELVASHPRLTREDIQAALAFAAESVRMERLGAVQHAS